MSGQNFFSQRIINFFHKDTDDYEDECYDFRMSFLILNKYWECHEITEYLKIYSWSKHVKQINEFLMAMGNTCMWWHFKFLFGQTVFLNCLTECRTSCLWFSICLLLLIFLSYFRSFVKSMVVFLWSCSLLSFVFSFFI